MEFKDFIRMCKSRDWEKLIDFLSSSIKDQKYKIVVSAILGEYYPDKNNSAAEGLSMWNKYLSIDTVTPVQSLFTGEVSLIDFSNAYVLATAENALNDPKIADAIRQYVVNNKISLGRCLESGWVSEEDKNTIMEFFGDLRLSKKEKEAYFKQYFAVQAEQKRTLIRSSEKVRIYLEDIFDLKKSAFRVYFSKGNNKPGFFSSSDGGEISFNKDIPRSTLEAFTEVLKAIGVGAHFYNMSSAHTESGVVQGIQLHASPEKMSVKLASFKQFLAKQVAPEEGFVKAADYLEQLKQLEAEQPAIMKVK